MTTEQTSSANQSQLSFHDAQAELLKVHIESAGYTDRDAVISDVDFSISPGQLVGLIGPNGAGKSTTVKAILGLLTDFRGDITMNGTYSYIPEHPILYDRLTLWEHLELAASAWELEQGVFEARAEKLLAKFRMTEVRHHLPSSFSKGMQQKVMLILAFLHEPVLYIVDEPFIGLDPRAIKDFLELLNEKRRRGAGVLMSTHVLDTAEKICDSFLLMNEGRLAAQGDLESIRQQCGMPGESLFECFNSLL
ncbi:ABC transporter ATP-binding protein [Paenibacillus sp. J2TS4]|uniref:ABC transporter ATP-binding protein n=1 Tax=Paenibacillus sp. J2TS4 TaxID=2807194 RepID=UPI001B1DF01C|nr:ABC transporter ATP-binding protein [Paenibacillus sp. J2TS4]GIP34775.1 multidrug ABC transporter ATP-binding protein [Paenibacillus sp. J2TS4]